MTRFEFPLDRVLTAKRQMERLAGMNAHRARRAAAEARDRLDALRGQLTRAADALAAAVGRPMPSHEWAAAADRSERLGQAIAAAERASAAAAEAARAADAARAKLAAEIEALDTLRAQRLGEWRRAAETAAQARLDEAGMRRWAVRGGTAEPGAAP